MLFMLVFWVLIIAGIVLVVVARHQAGPEARLRAAIALDA
jgi:predicted anti-sigma-YlaC factor YlaD